MSCCKNSKLTIDLWNLTVTVVTLLEPFVPVFVTIFKLVVLPLMELTYVYAWCHYDKSTETEMRLVWWHFRHWLHRIFFPTSGVAGDENCVEITIFPFKPKRMNGCEFCSAHVSHDYILLITDLIIRQINISLSKIWRHKLFAVCWYACYLLRQFSVYILFITMIITLNEVPLISTLGIIVN